MGVHRGWVAGVALVLGSAVGVAVAWPSDGPLPDPMYTAADLPALPDRADNGWHVLMASPLDVEVESIDSLHSATVEYDTPAERVGNLEEGERVAERTRDLERDANQAALAAWDEAAGTPFFSDACILDERESCKHFAFFKTSNLAAVRALSEAIDDGAWGPSFEHLADSLGMIRGLLETNRSTISAMVGLAAAKEHLEIAWLLLASAEPGGPQVEASRQRLRGELGRWMSSRLLEQRDIEERAFVGDYLNARWTLEGPIAFDGFLEELRFNGSHAARLLDEATAHARGDAASPPHCGMLERLWDAFGCDLYAGEDSNVLSLQSHRDNLAHERDDALQSLRRVQPDPG